MSPEDRENKIKLLNDILNKRKTVKDLRPSEYFIHIGTKENGGTKFYKDGIEITQKEHAEYIRGCPKPLKFNVRIGERL